MNKQGCHYTERPSDKCYNKVETHFYTQHDDKEWSGDYLGTKKKYHNFLRHNTKLLSANGDMTQN